MTYATVKDLLSEVLGISDDLVTPGMRLNQRDINLVSLARLIILCERTFGITIHDEDIAGFECLADLIGYIDEAVADGRDGYTQPDDHLREAWYYQ